MRPAIEALTADVCSEAFREAWSKGELSVNMTGNVELGADAPEQLLAAYAAASAVAVERAEQVETPEYAYASNAQSPGEITSREHVEDLDFTMIRFANGVAVNIKRTEFKKNQVLVTAKLGEGGLTLEPEQEVLKWVAGRVLGGAGLAAHSSDDLRRLLAGRQVSLSLGLGDSSFGLGGATTDEDLLLQCELIVARIASPGWREDGLVQFRKSLPLFYESLNHQHQGPMMREFMPAIYSGEARDRSP